MVLGIAQNEVRLIYFCTIDGKGVEFLKENLCTKKWDFLHQILFCTHIKVRFAHETYFVYENVETRDS